MDVMQPPLFWVDGSCYRRNPRSDDGGGAGGGDVADAYEEDGFGEDGGCPPEDEDDSRFCITESSSSGGGGGGGRQFRAELRVAAAFFPMLIGKGGTTKKRIEADTRTRINVPGRNAPDGEPVVVQGDRRSGVASACRRIDVIVVNSRAKTDWTHFISVPLKADVMKDAFCDFRSDLLRECDGVRGVQPEVFQAPELLHLTVGTMALMDACDRERAVDLLADCKENLVVTILDDRPIEIELSGLEIMNDDPGEVDVIYARLTPNDGADKLQRLSDSLVDTFVSAGLMSRQYNRVKLHVTLMNAKWLRTERGGGAGAGRADECKATIDSRPIFSAFADRHFAAFQLDQIHLSQRHASGRTKDGYYQASAVLQIGRCG